MYRVFVAQHRQLSALMFLRWPSPHATPVVEGSKSPPQVKWIRSRQPHTAFSCHYCCCNLSTQRRWGSGVFPTRSARKCPCHLSGDTLNVPHRHIRRELLLDVDRGPTCGLSVRRSKHTHTHTHLNGLRTAVYGASAAQACACGLYTARNNLAFLHP